MLTALSLLAAAAAGAVAQAYRTARATGKPMLPILLYGGHGEE